MKVKIFLVDDQDGDRQRLKALIEKENETELVGENARAEESLIRLNGPDILFKAVNASASQEHGLIQRLKKEFPKVKILMLMDREHAGYVIDMLEKGADGCILKNASRDDVMCAIRKIFNDGVYIEPEFTLSMLARYKTGGGFKGHGKTETNITEREMDVLQLVGQGLTNIQIARKLFTSVRTIETRRKNLLDKTKTTNTATLIRYAVLNGLIK